MVPVVRASTAWSVPLLPCFAGTLPFHWAKWPIASFPPIATARFWHGPGINRNRKKEGSMITSGSLVLLSTGKDGCGSLASSQTKMAPSLLMGPFYNIRGTLSGINNPFHPFLAYRQEHLQQPWVQACPLLHTR